ncbi:MAG: glycine betaine ABC transporter substrate-binding protein [Terriglobales bacterium]|jgi:glycine betaine/choline ABC-type transport system substrate-binding protein
MLKARKPAVIPRSRLFRLAACCLLLIALVACRPAHQRIVIGSKNFTEQAVLGELLAQYLEHQGLPVERRFYLAGTYVCHQALLAGRIDMYVEYTGTALAAILKQPLAPDHAAVYQRVREEYARRFSLEVTPPLGFNNTFAIVVRGEDARTLQLVTISDAARVAPKWRAGFGYEFMERADGFPGLANTYNLHFAEAPRAMDLGLLYRALETKQVDLIAGSATDGLIPRLDLRVLDDDKQYFPPYDAVPIVRKQTLQRYPALGAALSGLAGKISDEDMRAMNYAVDAQHRDAREVTGDFLRRKGL